MKTVVPGETTKKVREEKVETVEEVLTPASFNVICRVCTEKKEVFPIADVHWEAIWLRDILYDLFRPKEKIEKTLPQNMCRTCIEEIYVVNQFLQKYHGSTKILLEAAKREQDEESETVKIIYVPDIPKLPEPQLENDEIHIEKDKEPPDSTTEIVINENSDVENDINEDKVKTEVEKYDDPATELFYTTPKEKGTAEHPNQNEEEQENYSIEEDSCPNEEATYPIEEINYPAEEDHYPNEENHDEYLDEEEDDPCAEDSYANEENRYQNEEFIEDKKSCIIYDDDEIKGAIGESEDVDDPTVEDEETDIPEKKMKLDEKVPPSELFTEKPIETSKERLSLKDVWYMCSTCDEPFNNYAKLEEHKSKMSHREMQIFVCPFPGCEKKFRWHSRFVEHFRIHIDERPYHCDICPRSFRTSTEASTHIRQTHLNIAPHICDICQKAFKRKVHMDMHRKTHTGEKTVCSYCGKSFSTYSLYMHEQRHKIALGLKEPKKKPEKTGAKPEFQCHLCSQTLSSKHCLEQHIIRHGPKNYKCELCGKSYSSNEYLQSHINAKHTDGEYVCPFCNRDLRQKYLLEQHQKKVHPGEKLNLFSCEICEKAFSNSISFNEHVKVHKGETNHYCHQCDRFFASESKLNRHMRVHTGEKPFGCTVCEKKFASKDYLKIHIETHNTLYYLCEVCDASFTDNRAFKAHLAVHKDKEAIKKNTLKLGYREERTLEEEPKIEAPGTEETEVENKIAYFCIQCGNTFADEQILFDHIQMEHGDVKEIQEIE